MRSIYHSTLEVKLSTSHPQTPYSSSTPRFQQPSALTNVHELLEQNCRWNQPIKRTFRKRVVLFWPVALCCQEGALAQSVKSATCLIQAHPPIDVEMTLRAQGKSQDFGPGEFEVKSPLRYLQYLNNGKESTSFISSSFLFSFRSSLMLSLLRCCTPDFPQPPQISTKPTCQE